MEIKIKVSDIVDEMIERGITVEAIKQGDFGGWSNALLDTLEFQIELETLVRLEFKNRGVNYGRI